MTERHVYVQHLDPDCVEEYRAAHETVPEGVRAAMERGGVTEFEVYLRGTTVVCILECEDLDAYLSAVEGDPAVEEWERRVAEFKTEGVDADAPPDEGIPFADPVWSFRPE
ncbi:MAG: L-rhamnose mutarotase [Halobacteriaceae archaeon]